MDITATLCRICLENGADCAIFDGENSQDTYNKLSACLSEKIEDIKGYPRHICSNCDNTLNIVCDFINKYKESTKLLENGLSIIKQEKILSDDERSEGEFYSEAEIEVSDIKPDLSLVESNLKTGSDLLKLIKPLRIKLDRVELDLSIVKPEKTVKHNQTKPKTSKLNVHKPYNTNRIASSILENSYTWTGNEWCPTTKETPFKIVRKKVTRKERIQPIKKIVKTAGKDKNEPRLCDLCGAVFKDQSKLSKHKKRVHFPGDFQCPHCTKKSSSQDCLMRHIKRKHETSKDYLCSVCSKSFAFQADLTKHHKVMHEGKKRKRKDYTCKLCSKNYSSHISLVIHERSVHTGLRPAICTVCDSAFYHEIYLKEHMRLHTGETPFKCPVCGRGYAQRGNMKSHLRIHRVSELDQEMLSKIRPNYIKLMKV